MPACLRKLDLESWRGEVIELDGPCSPSPACHFEPVDGGWEVADLSSPHGTWVNGHRVARRRLAHGDAVWLREVLFVFLSERPLSDPRIERSLDDAPDDPSRVKVWADWLLERGDRLGEQLGAGVPLGALEGLQPFVASGQLELSWSNGLISAATLRCVDDASWRAGDLIARLLAVRVARWVRRLTIDVCSWVVPSALRVQSELGALLRGLSQGPDLPALEALSFGYLTEEVPGSSFLSQLEARVRARFPRLNARTPLLPTVHSAWLEVEAPAGVRFSGPSANKVGLESGIWVSGGETGEVRARTPGVRRSGVTESFIVRQEAPRWSLEPLVPGVLLNGRPAFATRLLPGDVIVDAHGVRYRFDVS